MTSSGGWNGSAPSAGNPSNELRVPEMVMLMATDPAALIHHEGTVTLIANAVNWDATDQRVDLAYDDAVARLEEMTRTLAAPAAAPVAIFEQPRAGLHPADGKR